ncbi:hypothetical protein EGY25_11765 [Brevundimonas intermedia]|uniref:Secreted protein n=1 Tax=Brevundimonas intermedia TaxID=74315 RepID=A0A4Y9RWQ4_9CAUL|nr:DUF6607 family protein [Brevundimonas intermedia]TFW12661.1 hypothetical protein EGY25_11765 [Brevundimonas intermedia]
MRAILIAAALLTAAAPTVQALDAAAAQTAQASAPASAFERDRQSILAQAGQYRVHFDMRENVSFRADYDPLEEKLSGGSEIVRIVYDKGDRISLQHILVMEHEGQVMVIKHWRHDWVYQPQTVLTYAGPNQWTLTPVPADQRAGAWSQTVWQTDDSPRYGGVGHWTYDNGLSAWTSNATWRPLARRDAVRNPVYDRYLGTNRHILTPDGWVHIQDNMKMSGKAGGEPVAIVQEDVINTYDRSTSYSPQAGDDYWTKTQGFWSAVRDAWDAAIATHDGIQLQEIGETGSVTGTPLMDLAQQIADGEATEAEAVAKARVLITEATTPR